MFFFGLILLVMVVVVVKFVLVLMEIRMGRRCVVRFDENMRIYLLILVVKFVMFVRNFDCDNFLIRCYWCFMYFYVLNCKYFNNIDLLIVLVVEFLIVLCGVY